MENTFSSQMRNSSHLLSPPSEPPDIRNWFPSYKYESFVLDTYDEMGGYVFKESESEREGIIVEEKNRENKGNLIESREDSINDEEDQSLNKMPDSLHSPSQSFLLSEPLHIRNWFSSYEYESPTLNTIDESEGSTPKKGKHNKGGITSGWRDTDREENIEGCRNSEYSNGAVGAAKSRFSDGGCKQKTSFAYLCGNKTLNEIPSYPQSSSFDSEPPDIGNWFSSYVYESPVLSEIDGLHDKTEHIGEDFFNQNSNKGKEINFQIFGQTRGNNDLVIDEKVHINELLKSSSANYEQENQSLNKDNKIIGKVNPSTLDNLHCERKQSLEFLDHCIILTEVEKSSFSDEGPICQQQQKEKFPHEDGFVLLDSNIQPANNGWKFPKELEAQAQTKVGAVSPGGNVELNQVTGSWMQTPTHRCKGKENEDRDVSGNGFVKRKKSRNTRLNDENSLTIPQESLVRCSRNKVMTSPGGENDAIKRKVLSEKNNFQYSEAAEFIGKWRCPQKSKPNIGPPLKQLRLEHWVQKL